MKLSHIAGFDALDYRDRMQQPAFTILIALSVLAGCATPAPRGSPESLTCQDIDTAVGQTAKDISRTAIRRGNVESYQVPFWVLGADRAKRALVDRDTRNLAELQDRQGALAAQRDRRCR